MADLIDRDAVLSDINEEIEVNQEYPEDKLIRKGLRIARKSIENAPAVNRWVSCSERLPEVYEKVLTFNDDGIIHDNFRLNLRDGSVGWSQGWNITHWQPRPEPPESKEESK